MKKLLTVIVLVILFLTMGCASTNNTVQKQQSVFDAPYHSEYAQSLIICSYQAGDITGELNAVVASALDRIDLHEKFNRIEHNRSLHMERVGEFLKRALDDGYITQDYVDRQARQLFTNQLNFIMILQSYRERYPLQ
jgi:hypothetical protein